MTYDVDTARFKDLMHHVNLWSGSLESQDLLMTAIPFENICSVDATKIVEISST